ncbi:MAG TPA: HAD-IA family hydrolase [Rhodanobacteraceae bacterium]|jgi:HAD superfamily hydrolase (TIGR01509 family)|nr:HAD-IA family hydrolase [Rhodanobacteraceae bacterium]
MPKLGQAMPIEAVIFDCDGTLVDSERLANAALVECVAPFGLAMTTEEAMQAYVGGRMADCVADLECRLGRKLPDSFIPEVRRRTAEAFRSHLKPVEGAAEVLRKLQVPACVASSGPMEKIELSLEVTGLAHFFATDRIFSAYDVGFWKPDPRLFLHAARAMGVAPGRCAVVEDSLPGVKAGIAAGMPTFWFRAPDDVPEPAMKLANLKDLPGMLADLAAPKSG